MGLEMQSHKPASTNYYTNKHRAEINWLLSMHACDQCVHVHKRWEWLWCVLYVILLFFFAILKCSNSIDIDSCIVWFTLCRYSCSVCIVSPTVIFSHIVLSFVLVYSNEALLNSILPWIEKQIDKVITFSMKIFTLNVSEMEKKNP